MSYVNANGLMTGGFACVAWPETYGNSGVKTFVVDRDGVVRQKDLGPESAARVRAMSAYAPDASWQKVD